jgi:hypothetical protein
MVVRMSNTVTAELSAAAEAIDSYQRRVGELAGSFPSGDRDDLVTAIYEAERSLGVAVKTIRRALRLAGG